MAEGDPGKGLRFFEAALDCPENLGEAKHFLADQSDIYYWLGIAYAAIGDQLPARQWWERAAKNKSDFQEMTVRSFSEMTYYSALALIRLNRAEEAERVLHSLLAYAQGLMQQKAEVDYFATSLPAMLLFEDDLPKRNMAMAMFLQAQANLGLGDRTKAQQLITQLAELDPNHPLVADLLAELNLISVAKTT
jgi:tetratricopeptide (TPR) repeat protein